MNYPTQTDTPPVSVARMQGGKSNITPELRLDAPNGYHKFFWITRGNGRIMIDGVTRGFGPHTLIYLPANTPHALTLGATAFGSGIALRADTPIALPLEPTVLNVEGLSDQSRMCQKFDTIFHEHLSRQHGSDKAIENYISLLCVHISRTETGRITPKENRATGLMRKFAHLVEDRFHTGQALNDYAADLGVTATHLTRVCQKLNGISASKLLQNRILAEARRELLLSDAKIQDVSSALGFASPAYFTRLFTQKLGLSPKDYRNTRAAIEPGPNSAVA